MTIRVLYYFSGTRSVSSLMSRRRLTTSYTATLSFVSSSFLSLSHSLSFSSSTKNTTLDTTTETRIWWTEAANVDVKQMRLMLMIKWTRVIIDAVVIITFGSLAALSSWRQRLKAVSLTGYVSFLLACLSRDNLRNWQYKTTLIVVR